MALNIKNEAAERLAGEVADLAGESKTRAVQVALEERHERLVLAGEPSRGARLRRFLEAEAWPILAPEGGNEALTKAERERILGYGSSGA